MYDESEVRKIVKNCEAVKGYFPVVMEVCLVLKILNNNYCASEHCISPNTGPPFSPNQFEVSNNGTSKFKQVLVIGFPA